MDRSGVRPDVRRAYKVCASAAGKGGSWHTSAIKRGTSSVRHFSHLVATAGPRRAVVPGNWAVHVTLSAGTSAITVSGAATSPRSTATTCAGAAHQRHGPVVRAAGGAGGAGAGASAHLVHLFADRRSVGAAEGAAAARGALDEGLVRGADGEVDEGEGEEAPLEERVGKGLQLEVVHPDVEGVDDSVGGEEEEGGGGGEREEGSEEKVVGHEALPERLGGVEAEHDTEVLELREEEGGRGLDGAHVGVRVGADRPRRTAERLRETARIHGARRVTRAPRRGARRVAGKGRDLLGPPCGEGLRGGGGGNGSGGIGGVDGDRKAVEAAAGWGVWTVIVKRLRQQRVGGCRR